jgi:GNAT superfamily N-acetyltransferase
MDPIADSPAPVADAGFRWIPIRSLSERHRQRVLTHLMALEPHDRYLRFGYAATDAQVGRYVDLLDFDRDELFGIFNRRLEIIAMAHLAYLPDMPGATGHASEFGVSVVPKARGRGYGARLFDHAVLHARNRRVDTMIIHALSENGPMLHIVRKAGASVERDGSEAEARLRLPPETVGSHLEELVEDRAAEVDYQVKSHVRRMDALKDMFTEMRAGITRARQTRIE